MFTHKVCNYFLISLLPQGETSCGVHCALGETSCGVHCALGETICGVHCALGGLVAFLHYRQSTKILLLPPKYKMIFGSL